MFSFQMFPLKFSQLTLQWNENVHYLESSHKEETSLGIVTSFCHQHWCPSGKQTVVQETLCLLIL